eukprot:TRINITY_DN728_c0_g1_i2.p4 TRINITY_DN728_c0_g1~~TRINITY_DN728_c0_g1_i2.p4  ORF type:complete len:246 (-),score=-19.64 TRINITY_DN728_c0_g1_i2:225-962(-)
MLFIRNNQQIIIFLIRALNLIRYLYGRFFFNFQYNTYICINILNFEYVKTVLFQRIEFAYMHCVFNFAFFINILILKHFKYCSKFFQNKQLQIIKQKKFNFELCVQYIRLFLCWINLFLAFQYVLKVNMHIVYFPYLQEIFFLVLNTGAQTCLYIQNMHLYLCLYDFQQDFVKTNLTKCVVEKIVRFTLAKVLLILCVNVRVCLFLFVRWIIFMVRLKYIVVFFQGNDQDYIYSIEYFKQVLFEQ